MALANDLTLNPGTYGGTAGDKIFKLVYGATANNGSLRRVSATATTTPETVTINHRTLSEANGLKVDQHQVRLDQTLSDTLLGNVKASCWIVLKVPQGTSVVTASVMKDLLGRTVHAVLQAGATDALLAGES